MDWRWQSFEQLSKSELYAILAARQEVFVVGQNIRYVDADSRDFACYHLSGWQGEQLWAYLRVIPVDSPASLPVFKIGRVLTRPVARGQGWGQALMQELLSKMRRDFFPCLLTMSAQKYLEDFYQKFGFHSEGEPFYEEGLAHIHMSLSLRHEKLLETFT